MLKRVFSLQNATPSEIVKNKIGEAVKKYQKHPLDHGSAAVQVAAMSEQIILSLYHVKKYKRDLEAARRLTALLAKRRKMLAYLARTDYHRYKWVCMDYGIP